MMLLPAPRREGWDRAGKGSVLNIEALHWVLFWKVWLSHRSALPLLQCCRRVSEDEVCITVFRFLGLFLVQIQWVFLG